MTEKEFDKFFKDRLDDDQGFEYRSDDWFAAAHELDKVLPVSAPVAVAPPPRLLSWHKWAAAAAILILGSQAWLMTKMFDLKHEIVSLKSENNRLAQQSDEVITQKRFETVIQYDTITKTVVIEKPIFKKVIQIDDIAKKAGNLDNENIVITQNDNIIAQNDTFNTSTKVDKSILELPVVAQTALEILPNKAIEEVRSNRLNQAKLQLQESMPIILPKVKPTLFTNGWVVSVNVLGQLDRKRKNKYDDSELAGGYNARLSYQLRSNWRVAADVDFWNETQSHPDSMHRPPFQPPTPDYNLSRVEMKQKKVQIRLGGDYAWANKSIVTPFVGLGLVYQITTKDDIEYQFKSPRNPTIPVSILNDRKYSTRSSPVYLSLRAGLSGTFYKRLGWSLDMTKDMPFGASPSKTLSGHLGLTYAL